ncbi:Protein DOWNSTREAM OF FLC [Bienertia sinuspersici]
MTKSSLLVLLALASLFVAMTVAKKLARPYELCGRVYCDTCRFGFETNVTTYINGATVQLECNDKSDSRLVFTNTTTTDENGMFKFIVDRDHRDQCCEVVLLKSPWPHCKVIDKVRSHSEVIITDLNGISSYIRHANNLGVFQDYALPVCAELYKYYFPDPDQES